MKKGKSYFNVVLCLLFILAISKNTKAATYYVDNLNGNDSNSGLQAKPWATLQKSAETATAGDTVVIVSNGVNYPYNEILTPVNSGTEDNWIIFKGESSSNKPYIIKTGIETVSPCFINTKSYLEISDIIFKDAPYKHGVEVTNSHHIRLTNLEIRNIPKNGILVNGGGNDIVVDGCIVENCGNNGIAFIGATNQLHDTIIRNCTVSNVTNNDGITLHEKGDGSDIGSNHLIQNNVLTNCGEQGIDITSGSDITVVDNKTSNNEDGIVIGHNPSNIVIKRHTSENETRYGIIISSATNVELSDSVIDSNGSHAYLAVGNCNGFSAYRNILFGKIDISPISINLEFNNNIFTAKTDVGGKMIRYLQGTTPVNTSSTFDHNIWWNPNNNQRVFYDDLAGMYYFETFRSLYAPNDRFVDPETLPPEAPQGLRIITN